MREADAADRKPDGAGVQMPALDVMPAHWRIVQEILHRHVPDDEVWAFGSRVRGTARAYSDLDLAIIRPAPVPLGVLAALREDFVESELPWKVDVLDWASTSEAFRAVIEREHVPLQRAR